MNTKRTDESLARKKEISNHEHLQIFAEYFSVNDLRSL